MKIGFVCAEYFGFKSIEGKLIPTSTHGGFGFLTKVKAEWLANEGHDVHVFTYAASYNYENNTAEELNENGVTIHLIPEKERVGKSSFSSGIKQLSKLKGNDFFREVLTEQNLQILQFEDTPTTLLLAEVNTIPKILIFQDPFDYYDVNLLVDSQNNYSSLIEGHNEQYVIKREDYKFSSEIAINYLHKKNFVSPIRKLLVPSNHITIFAEADFIGEKVKNLFKLASTPITVRNPIQIYDKTEEKTHKPSFVWVARWDAQKRPDTMLEIASQIPEYDFYLIGTATVSSKDNTSIQTKLETYFSRYPNIHILGFVQEEEKRKYIGKAWALINTSIREGLPITFLEAMAEGTPIISYTDPDRYVSNFGIRVDYSIKSYISAIYKVVEQKLYEKLAGKEREFIMREHEVNTIMNKHLDIYKKILNGETD